MHDLEAQILAQGIVDRLIEDRASSPTTPQAAGNLRDRSTRNSFVGRAESSNVCKKLIVAILSPWLVTVIGPGGVGKTRLAVETAATVQHYPHRDGAWLVEPGRCRRR